MERIKVFSVITVFTLSILTLTSCGKKSILTFTQVNNEYYELTKCEESETETTIELPDTYKGLPVAAIAEFAFSNNSTVRKIVIPDSVTTIGEAAFLQCSSLEEIRLPAGLTEISSNMFNGCSSLTEVRLPEGVTVIGPAAFASCSALTSINLPDGLTTLGNICFDDTPIDLMTLPLPDSVRNIGEFKHEGFEYTVTDGEADAAFLGTSDTLTAPESVLGFPVTTISVGKLECDKVTSFYIPQTVVLKEKMLDWQKYKLGYLHTAAINVLDACSSISFREMMPESFENAVVLDQDTKLPIWNRILPVYIYEDTNSLESPRAGTCRVDGWIFNLLPPEIRSESGTDADCFIISTVQDEGRDETMLFNGIDVGTSVYLYYTTGELYRIYYHHSSPDVGDKGGTTGDTMTGEEIWANIKDIFE